MSSKQALHPVIRISGFLILAAGLSLGGLGELLVAGVILAATTHILHARIFPMAWPMLRRMRWLFLSLLVIYFWFTPGQPLLFPYGPSLEGIQAGLLRISLLIMLVVAVSLLLCTTPRAQLIAAIQWLAWPLRWIGVEADRLAVRMALTLETVADAQHLLRQRTPARADLAHPIAAIGAVAADLFQGALARAEYAPCPVIEVPDYGHPPIYQWLYPLLLAGILWLGQAGLNSLLPS